MSKCDPPVVGKDHGAGGGETEVSVMSTIKQSYNMKQTDKWSVYF